MNAFGIDISRYDYSADGSKKPDFGKVKDTCSFIAIRSGISWGYADAWFAYSWEHCKGMARMAYHVPYFGESAQAQADNLFKIVGDADWKHDRLVLDCEVAGSNSKAQCTQTTNAMLEICKRRTGMYPIIYSRANWVNSYLSVGDMPKLDWWLAQYRYALPYPLYTPEKDQPPTLPNGVTDWLIHQTAERYNGSSVGVVSHYVDSNRWNGDMLAVLKYLGYDETEPEVPLTLEQQVADHEIRLRALEAG
jgi:GH25 family lysozyme M1 (1,4-beta-N-acetylmuramidase)